jgi:von Willebrand factor A domain-containing protein 5
MTSPILSVSSPSHLVEVQIGNSQVNDGSTTDFNPALAGVSLYLGDAFLDKDFVLIVKAKDLDAPRCVVELDEETGSSCGMLTMVPKFALNEVRSELVFLVDRSGSMEGFKTEQTAKALQVAQSP